jgi:RNA polymerase sigma-70 factor (ECF subfamily)
MTSTDLSETPRPDTQWGDQSAFVDLLGRARAGESEPLGELLQWYSSYLTILASTQLDRRLRKRLNPSDIVQEAMLAAHKDFSDFRGASQAELLCWLRTILIHTLHRSFAKNVKVEKRDVRREVSLDDFSRSVDESVGRLAALLPAKGASPSAPLQASEDSVRLADQLNRLKPQYRDVIVFRVLQGLSFEEIALRMDRSGGAVRMLWLRALEILKTSSE